MHAQHCFAYEHADVPPGVTLVQWRRSNAAGRAERTPSVRAFVRWMRRRTASGAGRAG